MAHFAAAEGLADLEPVHLRDRIRLAGPKSLDAEAHQNQDAAAQRLDALDTADRNSDSLAADLDGPDLDQPDLDQPDLDQPDRLQVVRIRDSQELLGHIHRCSGRPQAGPVVLHLDIRPVLAAGIPVLAAGIPVRAAGIPVLTEPAVAEVGMRQLGVGMR